MNLAKIKCTGYEHVMQWANLLYTELNVGQILCMGERDFPYKREKGNEHFRQLFFNDYLFSNHSSMYR